MSRRRAATWLVAVLLSAGLAGCADGGADQAVHESARATQDASGAPPEPATSSPGVAHAAPPVGAAPTQTFAVGVRELALNRGDDRPLAVTIWYPAAARAGGAPRTGAKVAGGRFPVVLFSHGLTARPLDYQPLLSRWAAAGFVVVAPAYPHTSRGVAHYDVFDVVNQPADASYVVTEVLALDGTAGDPLHGHLRADRVAAAGHSAGGITTVGLFTVARDDRLDAGIVLSGSALGVGTAFRGPAAPQLFVHGQLDDVVSYGAGKAAYDRVPWPKALLSLADGDHGGSLLRSGNAAFGVVTETTVEFLRWTLYGDAEAKRRLPTDARRGGLATLDDHL